MGQVRVDVPPRRAGLCHSQGVVAVPFLFPFLTVSSDFYTNGMFSLKVQVAFGTQIVMVLLDRNT